MTQQSQSKQPDEIFCSSCRAIIKREADICVHCGVRVRGTHGPGYLRAAGSQLGTGLNAGAIVGVAAGVVLFVASFLPWYSIDAFGFSFNRNGWQSPGAEWSIAAAGTGVATVLPVLLMLLTRRGSPWTVAWALAILLVGVGALTLVLLKLTEESSYLSYGFYIAVTAAAAVIAGGVLASVLAFVQFLAVDEARRRG